MMANSSDVMFSPVRNRRSLVGAQFHKQANRDSLSVDAGLLPAQNDDDAEKRQRQQERLLELQAQNLNSPATPKDRRNSLGTGLSGLTNSQLAEHYEDCIRLSAENKITVKNAFVLHLIDYMSEMLKNRDEPTNFQVASCTLDASAKIYAVRVDSVHNEVFKMVGNLGIADEQKRKKPVSEEDALENEEPTAKRKQKAKKSVTIEQNLKTLNLQKLDMEHETDPLFQRMTSLFDEGGVAGLMVNSLRCLDGNCELILDSSIVPEERCRKTPLETPTLVQKENFEEPFSCLMDKKICPTFEEFTFTGWTNNATEDFSMWDKTFKEPEKRTDLTYRPVSPNSQLDEAEEDDGMQFDGDDDAAGDCETHGQSVMSERRDAFAAAPNVVRAVTLDTIDDIAQVLADKPSDYSYFNNQLISAWAGPHHWKLRPSAQSVREETQLRNGEARKRVKKVPNVLDYSVEIDTTVRHRKSKLPKRTIQTTELEKTTLPEDLHYIIEDLTRFMLKTTFYVKPIRQVSEMEVLGDEVNYNYDNANDCGNYCASTEESGDECPGGDANEFDAVIDETALHPEESIFPETQLPFTGENLVQQPYKIDNIKIQYARTAKKIDVKKLKRAMWNILTKNENQDAPTTAKMKNEIKFSELYAALPSRMSEMSARDLSVPIAFVSFLHIVNEQNLALEGQEDHADFIIRQS